MGSNDFMQITVYLAALILLTPVLGQFMASAFQGERTFLTPILGWAEEGIYKITGVGSKDEMGWKEYAGTLLIFNFIGFLFVLLLQLVQAQLPFNPQHFANVPLPLAFNTAVSFMTNTNWQAYSGETTLSYLVQMLALTVQNFLSASTGIAVLLAFARGIARRKTHAIGSFWVDLVRSTLYVLLPLSLIFAVILVGQGVVQTFSQYIDVTTLEGAKQTIPLGPAASQIAIKQLGTNGGGFFNANSAHPFENPTPLCNFLEMLAILLIPAALTYTYGVMVKSRRQGWIIFAVMLGVWLFGLGVSLYSEYHVNPIFNSGVMLEGKEVRFGVVNSLIWSTATTVASNGSINAMHASLSPLAGGVALFNIMLGEIIFGGVGSGLYGMLLFVLLTVFLAGLMVGRTPEYLGKKIEAREIQMAILAIIIPSAVILVGAGIACVLPIALSSLANKGPHGLSEILYAYSSAAGNNGSAFAGLNANTTFYNVTLGFAMLLGRFGVLLPCLAIAGSLASKAVAPKTSGTFSTDTPIFALLLTSVIIIVGALTFLPCLSLGPIIEHFLMLSGKTF